MKILLLSILSVCVLQNHAQQRCSLSEKWQTDTTLQTPESVLFYKKGKFLFVSNINGKSGDKDGNGSIAKVALDGTILNADWITGLNAPKGLGVYKNLLYVTDLTEIVVIDIAKSMIIKKITIDSAKFLNDLTVDAEGTVYVSDSRTGKVHSIKNDVITTYIEKLQGPNGLLITNEGLYVLDRGSLLLYKDGKQIAKVADGMDASTDGIEQVNPNEFVVSCWSGVVYYIFSSGAKQVILDTRTEKINSADIGYNAKEKVIYIPTFYKNKVVAYELKWMQTNFNANYNNK